MCRDEIQRIKSVNPDISHREAFSAAAKNVMSPSNIFFYFLQAGLFFTKLASQGCFFKSINSVGSFDKPVLFSLCQWAHFPHIHFGLMPDQTVKKTNVRQQVLNHPTTTFIIRSYPLHVIDVKHFSFLFFFFIKKIDLFVCRKERTS